MPDNNAGESTTAQENNTIKSNGYVIISKSLELSLSRNQIDENNKNRISLEIKRSGDWSKTETFSLNVTNDDRVTIPTSISIPANQSIYAVILLTILLLYLNQFKLNPYLS